MLLLLFAEAAFPISQHVIYDDPRYTYDAALTYDGAIPSGLTGSVSSGTGVLVGKRIRALTGTQLPASGTLAVFKVRGVALSGTQPLSDLAVYDDFRITYNDTRFTYNTTTISQLTWRVAYHVLLTGDQPTPDGAVIPIRVRHTTLTGSQDPPSGQGVGHRQRYLYGIQPISQDVLYEDPRYTYDDPGLSYESLSAGTLTWSSAFHYALTGEQPPDQGEFTFTRLTLPWSAYWPVIYNRPEELMYIVGVDTGDTTVRYQVTVSGGPNGIVYRETAPLQNKEHRE